MKKRRISRTVTSPGLALPGPHPGARPGVWGSQASAWWPGLCPRDPAGLSPEIMRRTWNVTSLGGKEPELVREVERYRLEIVGLTSTHSLGSGTQLLERGWTLHYSGVAQVHVAPGTLGRRSMIDFVVVSSDLRPYVLDTRVKRGAELSTNRSPPGGELGSAGRGGSWTDLADPNIPREAGDIESEWTMFSASIVDARGSSKLWTQGLWCLSWWQSPNPVVDTGSTGRPSKHAAQAVLEAKTRVWEEFGEAMEEDYRSASKRFWQTVRRLRRGKQYSANTVYSAQPPREGLHARVLERRGLNSAYSRPLDSGGTMRFSSWSWNSGPALYPPQGAWRVYGSLPKPNQSTCACFVDLEKAFDRVPRGILWGSAPTCFPVHVGLRQGCPLSPVLFIIFMDRISRRSQGPEGVRFGNHRISSLLFADDVVLLASSSQDLQHVLERFAAECEAAGMRISTSKSEAMVLDRKRVACPLRVGGEVLPQVEEFKYLGVLFTSEGKMEREIDRRIGAASAVMRSVYHRPTVVVKKELSRKAKLSIYRSIYVPTLTSPMVMNFG
ncbi:hypothetical protein L3Q82_014350 [Scortum barcoo]|uniref:Uncharacterized protein n=1 Tax=Scortum barcoo TaxID=214431 RepID=A0ACB8VWP8_9TELE|nr:hypothetical protein L3Q82_014350 [Scortum barcoo]